MQDGCHTSDGTGQLNLDLPATGLSAGRLWALCSRLIVVTAAGVLLAMFILWMRHEHRVAQQTALQHEPKADCAGLCQLL